MRPRRRAPKPGTLIQIRTAALRRWGPADTTATIAERLAVREWWVSEAMAPDFRRVVELYTVGSNAGEIAASLELPEHFVTYCFRRINAAAAALRSQRRGIPA